ncbi:MAG: hypothetical protein AAF160_03035 [Pseudomonadota bacterium]
MVIAGRSSAMQAIVKLLELSGFPDPRIKPADELEHLLTLRAQVMLGLDPSIHGWWRRISGSSPAMTQLQ